MLIPRATREPTPRPLLIICQYLDNDALFEISKRLRNRPSNYHHIHIGCRSTDGTADLEQRNGSDVEPFEIEDPI